MMMMLEKFKKEIGIAFETINWHRIWFDEHGQRQPCEVTMKIVKRCLKNVWFEAPTAPATTMTSAWTTSWFGRFESFLHYVATLGYYEACYLAVDHGADPSEVVDPETKQTVLDIFGRGSWLAEVTPLPEAECKTHCDEMRRRRAVYLETKRRNDTWKRRRDAMMMLAGCGHLPRSNHKRKRDDDNMAANNMFGSLPPISRRTRQENVDYLNDAVFGNPLIHERIVTCL